MRDALAGLTLRGRALLGAGLAAMVCALVLDQTTLVRAGVLVIALPLIAAVVLARSQYRLALGRVLTPATVPAGSQAEVRLTFTNEGRTPTGILRLEEQLPYALGPRPRFVLDGVSRGWRRQVRYQVRCEQRGRFTIGPMRVQVGDPFGLVALQREFSSTATLLVTPRTVDLPPATLPSAWSGSGEERPRSFATGSAEDVTVRSYRRGDDLRRVHWRSSARSGELMVRREEQPWQARATLLLDDRAAAHRGSGASSSWEAAVTAAASIGVHLIRQGYAVHLVTATQPAASESPWHGQVAASAATALIESLAVVETHEAAAVSAGAAEQVQGGLVIAVLGAVGEPDVPALRRLQQRGGTAVALTLDVDTWAGAPADPLAGALLGGLGWRSARWGAGESIDRAWLGLTTSPRRDVAPAGGPR